MESRPSRTYRGKSLDDRRAERRARFIDAALTVYGRQGFANSTLTDVCAAAKLSRRQFYELFDNPEDLLIAAYDDTQARVRQAVLDMFAASTDSDIGPWEVAHSAMRALFRTVSDDPRRARVAFVEVVGVSDRVEAHREKSRDDWADFIGTLRTELAGLAPISAETNRMLAAAYTGAVNGLVQYWHKSAPGYSVDELVDMLSDITLALYSEDGYAGHLRDRL